MKKKYQKYGFIIFVFCSVFFAKGQIHVVKENETLYSLSKKYEVSIEDLKKWNPEIAKKGLQKEMQLKILKNNKIKNQIHVVHVVKENETLYSLSKKYEVSIEDLKKWNPEIAKKGLQKEMQLKIPPKNIQESIISENKTTPYPMFKDTIPYIVQMKVALFLPLKLSEDCLSQSQNRLFRNANNLRNLTTEFYMGAQMAIDSLYKKGLFLDLKMYDTENNSATLKNILNTQEDLKDFDFVIGPLYSDLVPMVANYFKNIPVIYPFFSKKQHLFHYENLVKVAIDKALHKRFLFDYILSNRKNENITIMGDTTLKDSLMVQELREALLAKIPQKDTIFKDSIANSLQFLSLKNKRFIPDSLFFRTLDTLKQNWILLNTQNPITTSMIVNYLKKMPTHQEMKLFAFEKNKNFEKIENQTLSHMNFTYVGSEILHLKAISSRVKNFYEKFYKKNYFYPTKYALKGFDLVYDLALRMIFSKEKNVPLQSILANGKRSERINNTFLYKKDTITGTINNSILYLIQYQKDLSLKILQTMK